MGRTLVLVALVAVVLCLANVNGLDLMRRGSKGHAASGGHGGKHSGGGHSVAAHSSGGGRDDDDESGGYSGSAAVSVAASGGSSGGASGGASSGASAKKKDGVTAALLSWKRTQNWQAILQNLSKFHFIKEVVIWNNNKNITLESKMWHGLRPDMKLVLVNKGINLNNEARYQACAIASYDVCYMQDDDWTPQILQSLYESYKSQPKLVHLATTDSMPVKFTRWSYFNKDKHLHAAFAFIGVASFMPKTIAEQFLYQLNNTGIDKKYSFCCDVMFTIWTNEIPVILTAVNSATQEMKEDEHKVAYSRSNQKKYADCRIFGQTNATEIALKFLSNPQKNHKDGKEIIPTTFHSKDYKEWTLQALAEEDYGIFLSNVHLYPWRDTETFTQDKAFPYMKEFYTNLETSQTDDKVVKKTQHLRDHDPQFAVDKADGTFWQTPQSVKAKDFFGIRLNNKLGDRKLKVVVSHSFQQSLKVEYSDNGKDWHEVNASPEGGQSQQGRQEFKYHVTGAAANVKYFRFVTREDHSEHFKVHTIAPVK